MQSAIDLQDPPPASPGTVQVRFEGRVSDVALIVVRNIVLSILTLGFYRFWGRVKLRRYLWEHTRVGEDALAYTGTPRELIMGAVKLVGVVALLVAAVGLGQGQSPIFVSVLLGALSVLGKPFLVYGARRYRLSRTTLRNVPFGMRPAVMPFIGMSALGSVLSLLTLGGFAPVQADDRYRMLTDNMTWGSQGFRYTGRWQDTYRIVGRGMLGVIFTLGIYTPWLLADLHRYRAEHTWIDGAHLRVDYTGGDLWNLWTTSVLATVLTLGLAYPWVLCRNWAFHANRLQIVGSIDLNRVGAAPVRGWAGLDDFDAAVGVSLEL